MKDFSYYSTSDAEYPGFDFVREYVVKKMQDQIGTELQLSGIRSNFIEEAKQNKKHQMGKYRQSLNDKYEEFKTEIFEEFGVTGNPKATRCLEMAYERRHSEGYQFIYDEFDELVELIK